MAHAITIRKNGLAEMAYVGTEKPWHGLGQSLEAGADMATWKEAAGMDWNIKTSPVTFGVDGEVGTIPDSNVLYRSDTKEALSIVSSKYKIVQPGEVLDFFHDLTDANGFTLDTAGTLFDGRRFWALASIGESACIVGDDKVDGYLLLSSSCDGTLATTARFTTVRVVCNNTLGMALQGKAREVVISHRTAFDANKVKNQLGIARGNFGDFLGAARQLAATSMSTRHAEEFVENLLRDSKMIYADDVSKSKQYMKIMDLFQGGGIGSEMQSAEGTAWGLLNSVTEYIDHHATAKTNSHRMANAWFGKGDDLKSLTLQRLLATA
jgi:phage/plasmid-like protein (TIGR03299 family)